MPKMKTNSSAKKRFKLTGSGRVKRYQANAAHLMRKKTKKRKLRLNGSTLVHKSDERQVKRLLCKK
jgi:large subunit ribosomal protein L35